MRAFGRRQARTQRGDDGVIQIVQPCTLAQRDPAERKQRVAFSPVVLCLVIQLDHRALLDFAMDSRSRRSTAGSSASAGGMRPGAFDVVDIRDQHGMMRNHRAAGFR